MSELANKIDTALATYSADQEALLAVHKVVGGEINLTVGDVLTAAEALRAAAERIEKLENEAAFLLERLADFDNDSGNKTEQGENEWDGHVAPSISRLKGLVRRKP